MTQQRRNSQSPTWQSVKGELIHRCVLAAAGKWLTIAQAAQPDDQNGLTEPHLAAEARWMAQVLGTALNDGDDQMAQALIDSGGPRWSGPYNNFLSLGPGDRQKAIKGLEELAVTTAHALLELARRDHWDRILSEVVDPFAMLNSFTYQEKIAANRRIDLLVHRGRYSPLIVDLKTSVVLADVDELAQKVAGTYGQLVADVLDIRIRCQVLGISFDGDYLWSETITVYPSKPPK